MMEFPWYIMYTVVCYV